MKKPFFLFTFSFLLFTLQAQDTLVLRNGQKMGVKVISVTDKVIYTTPPDTNPMSINASKVNYIRYRDGAIYTININHYDTITATWQPYILFSGGINLPYPSGYGGNTYSPDDIGYGYSGYAYFGSIFSFTAGLKIYRGWELTGMFSYIRNRFDATTVMNETFNLFINYNTGIDIANINTSGNYYYTNYSGLLGVTKNWENKHGGLGISLLMGTFYTNIPALRGTGVKQTYSNGIYTGENIYFNMDAESQSNFALELGIHYDVNITRHIFVRGLLEFLFSGITTGGNYQIVSAATGNPIFSGGYTGFSYRSSNLFVWLTNITGGVGYKF